MTTPALSPQQQLLTDDKIGAFEKYRRFAVGNLTLINWILYELFTTLFSNLSGILGYGSRSFFYPLLFDKCGKRVAIGKGVTIRRPQQIRIGKNVMIDDYAVLDVRGDSASIEIEDHVAIGRFTTIVAKEGKILIKKGANIGSYCRVATQSKIEIGESTLIAAYAYVGPGNHKQGDSEIPRISSDMEIKGGVVIGAHSWIGAHATLMDGVTIGEKVTVGAYALVKDDVADNKTVLGIPAKEKN